MGRYWRGAVGGSVGEIVKGLELRVVGGRMRRRVV